MAEIRNVFLTAVENDNFETVKSYLSPSNNECKNKIENETWETVYLRFEPTLAEDHELDLNNIISFAVWMQAFWIAASKSKETDPILDMLLDDDRFNKDGQTVLQLAVKEYLEDRNKSGWLENIDILLKSNKYDVDVVNSEMETVLCMICKMQLHRDVSSITIDELLKVLLKHGADLNRRNFGGQTVLMMACETGRSDIVQSLINLTRDCGVYLDFDAVDNTGETALMIVKKNYDSTMVPLLERLQISQRELFLKAVETEDKEFVKTILHDASKYHEEFFKLHKGIAYRNAKNWTYHPEYTINDKTWEAAMNIAIEKSSEVILKLLLDYDVVVQSQKIGSGDTIIQRFFSEKEAYRYGDHILRGSFASVKELYIANVFTRKQLLVMKVLLESGKINVNAVNFSGNTVLHSVVRFWRDDNLIHDTIKLLLCHNANVNQKDKDGRNPLPIARNSAFQMMLNWAEKTGTSLDLDARYRNGRTALINAVSYKDVEDVELLLNAGASVNVSDNRGFTALHHALYERPRPRQWIDYGEFPRNSKELNLRKQRVTVLAERKECNVNDESEINEKMKIVELLLKRPGINVNALDCEGYSPMDIAEASIPEIPSSLREALEQKGATLNLFQQKEPHYVDDADLDFKYSVPLHRLAIRAFDDTIRPENFYRLSEAIEKQTILTKDQRGRTPLHYAIICSRDIGILEQLIHILDMMIDFGCSVNETDIYGRTPLHYATREIIRDRLIKRKADPKIEDRDGISAIDMSKMLEKNYYSNSVNCNKGVFDREKQAIRNVNMRHPNHCFRLVDNIVKSAMQRVDETNIRSLFEEMREVQNKQVHNARKMRWCKHLNPNIILQQLLKQGMYAHRHPLAKEIEAEARAFMKDLASAIKNWDSRFEIRPMLVGSSYEGTKIGVPDEFDFSVVLTQISKRCEVFQSPELPSGYVHLKRKHSMSCEAEEKEYDNFFNKDEILITEKVKEQFNIILINVLKDTRFIQSQQNFDWDWYLGTKGLINTDTSNEATKWFASSNFKLATTFRLNRTKFRIGDESIVEAVSVDIAPCIHIDGWWPDEAIANVSDDIKAFGCILVFDYPQRFFPWVPFSESCARISFATAESEIIKRSSDLVKQVYMIGKQLISTEFHSSQYDISYVLKNCLLHCIEAFAPTQEMYTELGVSFLEWQFNFSRMDLQLWLECLMKCHLDFVLKDFCPCYFMPSFCMPNPDFAKYSRLGHFGNVNYDYPSVYLDAYRLYCCTSLEDSESCINLSRLNPIWEKLDRKAMIRDLIGSALKILKRVSIDYSRSGSKYCDDFCKTFDPFKISNFH